MFRLTARVLAATLLLTACSKSASSQGAPPSTPPASADAGSSDVARNDTPLPAYPHLVSAMMFSVPNDKGCIEYTSSTHDKLEDAIAWYRTKLGGAKETPFTGDYRGVDFTVNGTDHVMVFALGNTGTSITMRHATTGKGCGRADGRAG